MIEFLRHRTHDLDIDRFGQPGQFFERIGDFPGGIAGFDADQEGVFIRLVRDVKISRNGSLLSYGSNIDPRFATMTAVGVP